MANKKIHSQLSDDDNSKLEGILADTEFELVTDPSAEFILAKRRDLDAERSKLAHDLNTPLASIKGYTSLFLEGMAGDLTGKQLEFLQKVKRNADILEALILEFRTSAQNTPHASQDDT